MANLNITELTNRKSAIGTQQPEIAPVPFNTTQNLAVGGGSIRSLAFGATTRAVRLLTDTACHVKFGDLNVAAAATDMALPANVPEYFGVQPGGFIAVIT